MSWVDFDHEDQCPACLVITNGTTNTQSIERPKPGDRAICLYCHSINVYDENLRQRLPTTGEAIENASDPDLQELVWAMRMAGPPPSTQR